MGLNYLNIHGFYFIEEGNLSMLLSLVAVMYQLYRHPDVRFTNLHLILLFSGDTGSYRKSYRFEPFLRNLVERVFR